MTTLIEDSKYFDLRQSHTNPEEYLLFPKPGFTANSATLHSAGLIKQLYREKEIEGRPYLLHGQYFNVGLVLRSVYEDAASDQQYGKENLEKVKALTETISHVSQILVPTLRPDTSFFNLRGDFIVLTCTERLQEDFSYTKQKAREQVVPLLASYISSVLLRYYSAEEVKREYPEKVRSLWNMLMDYQEPFPKFYLQNWSPGPGSAGIYSLVDKERGLTFLSPGPRPSVTEKVTSMMLRYSNYINKTTNHPFLGNARIQQKGYAAEGIVIQGVITQNLFIHLMKERTITEEIESYLDYVEARAGEDAQFFPHLLCRFSDGEIGYLLDFYLRPTDFEQLSVIASSYPSTFWGPGNVYTVRGMRKIFPDPN